MTPEEVKTVLDRSAQGEGVANVLREMGLPVDESLEYLRDYHSAEIRDAKKRQREPLR